VAAGNEGHARIPGKHGSAPTVYIAVPVIVPDRPGELLRLLQLVAEERINVLSVEHRREGVDIPAGATGIDLTLLTRDHTLGAPGTTHALTRAVGAQDLLRADHSADTVRVHDRYLLCSDGVHGALESEVDVHLLEQEP